MAATAQEGAGTPGAGAVEKGECAVTEPTSRYVVLDGEARRFLGRTGVLVLLVEVLVLAGVWFFQSYFGR